MMVNSTIGDDLTINDARGPLLAGRYRVVRQLGQGGMGSVWLAEDTELDGFKVAIKMLPSVLIANTRAYEQLKAEALVSLKLTHPNIATVRAFEENGGNPFLVIDYIDGESLDDMLAEKGKLTEPETIRILTPVAAALDYAHGQGVVHRDVKPGNVMIAKDGTPFVLDFGIAREIQETMTRVTGKLSSGTLLYMSPEQLKGAAPKPAQDVYSFAAMAYECLKGEPPFSRGQIEWQILNEEPEPLVGGSLARSVMQGLSKVPSARPFVCREVLCAARRPIRSPVKAGGGLANAKLRVDGLGSGLRMLNVHFAVLLARPWMKPVLAMGVALLALVASLCWRASVSSRTRRAELERRQAAIRAQQEEEQDEVIRKRVQEGKRKRLAAERSRREEAARKREVETARKAAIAGVMADATNRLASVTKLSGEDGIGKLIADCEEEHDRAKEHYRAARWREAARAYTNVVEACMRIVALNARRIESAAAQDAVSAALETARRAGAEKHAKNMFAIARELQAEGDDAWRDMRFEDAAGAYRRATERYIRAAESAEATVRRQTSEKTEGKDIDALMEEAARLARQGAASARIVGTWTAHYSHIVRLLRSAPAKIVCEETLQINADGSYRQKVRDLTQSSVNDERGHWSLAGSVLTLRPDTGGSAGEAETHVLAWTGRDRFEMRLTDHELGKRRSRQDGTVKCKACYYDSVGILHEEKTDSRFSNGVYTVQVTPKWYNRGERFE